MIQERPTPLCEVRPGETDSYRHMTDSNHERGEKRGVLSTGRAKSLDKTKDADADAADDDEDED
ncbi:hypothetical protein ACFQL0_21340 [Haloplanus litoreus]|uniref:Uncharacterized protein n=2 Tax=Haloplanus litoreus TaxID=767515 RepID=A0ABD5ZUJ5_9EURY